MKGFFGKLLRINLTTRTYVVEEISEDILKTYLGGRGLASYLLLENLKTGIDPLSRDNKLIFVTGPATGTGMWGSSRYGVFSKSPQTGLYGEATSGGKVAPQMRKTGYDAIILEGVADMPLSLEISDQQVVFRNASDLWGKDTYETEDKILAEVGVPEAQAIVIGPAGENLVRFACIENNYWRSAGRTGMGAVMGSKKVKAIVFHGQAQAEISDPELLKDLIKALTAKAKGNVGVKAYQTYGTTQMVKTMNCAETFPTKYWSEGIYENWRDLSGDTLLAENEVKPNACPSCFLACGKLTTVTKGKYNGLKVEGPEYETIYAFGGLCGIGDLAEILYLNDLCDRLGMDTITAGNLVAFTQEAVRHGKVEANLNYGDAKGVADLLEDIAYARGLGGILSQGIKHAAIVWDLEDIAIHVKGLEPPGYDPRVLKGMGLAYSTSARGACHLRATFYKAELSGMIDPAITQGKAEMFIDFENRLTLLNTQILCVFYRDMMLWPELRQLVKAITGWDYTQCELEEIANRIVTLTKVFNLREGANREQDTLPKRMFKEPLNEGRDVITGEELDLMLDDYYRLRGWDNQGRPSAEL
ncbi:aldehyde ferredoxin oxidoreductase family protein [Desulfosporosinus sp. BICA1-9]|uniref:aldehyde ferredoxin oxidoreductase family protein n=1 Tax=Desulfosporosinus sp. BICA1-9 TaxID=1531958 RepID=UPI00054BB1D8|nr:aldehyde ferredoxin oxidoreductase family protein [Desulfosporosinus sp. BICA1-9]KJS50155.1 MAG: aldehyde:ferredoxin oxidoreductase [Peptococcaceae bacterium BRH_c23]KJS80979.1 MAG: aldehyde:ferredoxin oxidoreductase [Desulfosporosinus sp. BICA1-9]HBW37754.1 aldehyde:ferredoxin oxidoreductase [Desulfosporosinus sp.]